VVDQSKEDISDCNWSKGRCMYVCILRAGVQATLDPYAEAFL